MSSSQKEKKNFNNQVFHIKIGPNAEKLDIKNPAFLKLLEQEYATKYLENLGVEATQKNIQKILRECPLQNCQIIQSRLNGGLHTDTITIVQKKAEENDPSKIENQTVSDEMLHVLNLKPMKIQKQATTYKALAVKEDVKRQNQNENEIKNLEILNFSIKNIKQNYIFPFNENFRRKNNYRMKDQNLISEKEDSGIIFEAKIFNFPFSQVKLSLKALKQLQSPITTKMSQISFFLDRFYQQFPSNIFPIHQIKKVHANKAFSSIFQKVERTENTQKKSEVEKYSHLTFQQEDLDKIFELIKSEENVKFIGVFLHLAYWCIFGGVNPIQVDKAMKKKMYIMMFETLEYFQMKMENKKLWVTLGLPMILLSLKMASHYFFSMLYAKLFQSEESLKINAHELAFDKILLFIEQLFDQGNINGRFIFLESDIDGEKGNFIKDKKFIRKRIFGTSPAINLILPHPKDGKTRSIMAKNMQIDKQNGILEDHMKKKSDWEDKESQQKLLHLTLEKIKNRIEERNGNQNSILNLD